MDNPPFCRRALIAVDSSDQSIEAVRYAAGMLPPEQTEIVLFNVGTEYPEVFWDMDRNPLYRSKMPNVMEWLADHQLAIGEFKEKALKILTDAGFPEAAVHLRTRGKKTSILVDIIQETYQGYSVVVLGRTGVSWFKDRVVGSMAAKLVGRVKHIPSVIVGGSPTSGKILVALDDSIEAMRGVNSVGVLAGGRQPEVLLCHVLKLPGMFRRSTGRLVPTARELDWLEYQKNKFRPVMDEAEQRLIESGVSPGRIFKKFIATNGDPVSRIIRQARDEKYSTVVVGRREMMTFTQELLQGRFCQKIIKSADHTAVWVVG